MKQFTEKIKLLLQKPQSAIGIIILIILPLCLIVYVGLKWHASNNYKVSYAIDFNRSNFKNNKVPLYINEDINSPKFSSFKESVTSTVATIAGSPIGFVFQPKEFSLKKHINFSASIKDTNDWSVSLVCPECSATTRYDWKPFYYGWLNDYAKVASFQGTNIYAKNGIATQPAENIDQWISKNITSKNSITLLDNTLAKSKFANKNITVDENASTIIDKTFRGPHDFYVFLKDQLNVTIIKKDLNSYAGADTIKIEVSDLDGNTIFSDIMTDDGIVTQSAELAIPIKNHLQARVPKPGIYRLSIQEGDPSLSYNDWTITYLKVNSTKIVLGNDVSTLFLQPTSFYTEIKTPTDIFLNIWWNQQVQTTNFSTTNNKLSVTLKESDINVPHKVTLTPDAYTITFKGNERVSGAYFALEQKNYFDVYSNPLLDEGGDFIFTTFEYQTEASGFANVQIAFTQNDLQRIQDTKNINIQLKSDRLNEKFKEQNALIEKGYELVSSFKGFQLYGRERPLNTDMSSINDSSTWLKSNLMPGSTLKNTTSLVLDSKILSASSTSPIIILPMNDSSSVDYLLRSDNVTPQAELSYATVSVQN